MRGPAQRDGTAHGGVECGVEFSAYEALNGWGIRQHIVHHDE